MNKKLQIPKHAQLLPGKKSLEGLRFVVSELATRKLWIVVFKASEWMSCTGLNHPGPSRTMSLSFTNPENEWIRPRTQPAFFRGYASFGGSRISMFVLPCSNDVEAMTCEAFKTTWSIKSRPFCNWKVSFCVSSIDHPIWAQTQAHHPCVYSNIPCVFAVFFCPSKRHSQQNSMQKPHDPSCKFQVVSPTHRLRTTHFSGKTIKIIIAPKGHLRRSWPQLGTIMEDLCVSGSSW